VENCLPLLDDTGKGPGTPEGIAADHPNAYSAALFYLVAYLFMNLGAFFCVTRLELLKGSAGIEGFGGLWRNSPILAASTTLFLLSLAGIPPMSGYIAKVLILESLTRTVTWLAVVLALNVVAGAYYYLRVIASIYLRDEQSVQEHPQPTPLLLIAIGLCLAVTVVIGVMPQPLLRYIAL
jgi:NADH:ubiquinone oxidoreductase subunit 2 (subunit N)